MIDKSDLQIIQDTLEDIDNYKHIVERYEKRLLLYIKRMLYVKDEDAQDILQEVFIKAYRNLNSYNPKYKFSNWIYRITHNESVNFLRKNKNLRKHIPNDPDIDIFETLPSSIDIEQESIDESDKDEILSAISKLDKKYKDVLILKYLEEKDYNEISEILHISSGTVGSLISRGKVKLRNLLEKYGKNE